MGCFLSAKTLNLCGAGRGRSGRWVRGRQSPQRLAAAPSADSGPRGRWESVGGEGSHHLSGVSGDGARFGPLVRGRWGGSRTGGWSQSSHDLPQVALPLGRGGRVSPL